MTSLETLEAMAKRWQADMAKLNIKHNPFSRDSLGTAIDDLLTEIAEMEEANEKKSG